MGKFIKSVESYTQSKIKEFTSKDLVKDVLDNVGSAAAGARDTYTLAGRAVLLSLSKAWIGISLVKPADTEITPEKVTASGFAKAFYRGEKSETVEVDRFDTSKMWSIKFGDYFMPLSQTYSVRATKRLNISSLVDGVDIIQQTRKEAKTVDCTLKISINEKHKNLQIIDDATRKVKQLQDFLLELYEADVIFNVDNSTINETLGVDYAIMSSYRFMPRVGSKTFLFEFSLTEVKFGDNMLTFDERQIQEPTEL